MRHPILLPTVFKMVCLTAIVAVSACDRSGSSDVNRAVAELNELEGNDLAQVMLTVGNPAEAVNFFSNALAQNPDRIDLQRGLAKSLVRASRANDAIPAWQLVVAHPEANFDDSVELADAFIRANRWDEAGATLNTIPPTHETFKRYRLEAIVADGNQQWEKADSFYEIAAGLTTTPAGVLNNWGFSKLTRGDYVDAERLFFDSIRLDGASFTAKNNLVLARGAQRKYDLPVVPMDQTERARLLHTMALTAIKQNDISIGKGLLREAIDTHPQHFDEAVLALRALEDNVTN